MRLSAGATEASTIHVAASRALLCAAIAITASFVPRSARAEGVELRWETDAAIEGCPAAAVVEASIEEAVPESWVEGAQLVVHAHVDPLETGRLRLELWAQREESAGRRVLEAESCAALAEAAALIVSMLVAPDPGDGAPTTTRSPVAAATEEVRDSGWLTGSGATVDDPFGEPEAGPIAELRIAAAGGLSVGPLPSPSLLVGLRIELCVGRVCPFLGGEFVFPSEAALQAPEGATVEVWLASALLGVRHRTEAGPVSFGPALSIDVGAVGANSHGVSDTGFGLGAWVSASAGAFADVGTRRFRVGLSAAAQVPLARPSIVVERAGTVFSASPIGLATALSLEARFD